MSEKIILISGIVYAVATLILNNFLQTTIGGFMMTLSFLAFVMAIVGAIYFLIKIAIKQFTSNRSNRNNKRWGRQQVCVNDPIPFELS